MEEVRVKESSRQDGMEKVNTALNLNSLSTLMGMIIFGEMSLFSNGKHFPVLPITAQHWLIDVKTLCVLAKIFSKKVIDFVLVFGDELSQISLVFQMQCSLML